MLRIHGSPLQTDDVVPRLGRRHDRLPDAGPLPLECDWILENHDSCSYRPNTQDTLPPYATSLAKSRRLRVCKPLSEFSRTLT